MSTKCYYSVCATAGTGAAVEDVLKALAKERPELTFIEVRHGRFRVDTDCEWDVLRTKFEGIGTVAISDIDNVGRKA